MAPFFDPSKCPNCLSGLPVRPLRCPVCGLDLTGPTVSELVTTLRRADSLVSTLRTELAAAPPRPRAMVAPQAHFASAPAAQGFRFGPPPMTQPMSAPAAKPGATPARSWFEGKSVGVILLILGSLCVLAAGAVFIAVAWMLLPLGIRALILVAITASFGLFAGLALRRGLQATAEAMAVIAAGMFVLDLAAARRADLPGLADLAVAPYEILAGALLAVAAAAAALFVRGHRGWLWSLDAAVALGLTRAAFGALRLESDSYAVAPVAVTIAASLLYVACRRTRLPVAMWSALALGAIGWVTSVAVGTERAVDHFGGDIGRVAAAWPALVVSLVAGLWSTRLTRPVWRRVAACLCVLPVVLVFEIVAWSHGWVVGSAVVLAGFAVAAAVSAHVTIVWSPAVGGSAILLGLTAVIGLLPTTVALGARIGLAMFGDWRGPRGLPFDLLAGDVGPWLLPTTALVVLGLLPRITIDGHRLPLHRHHTAGVVVAALATLPMLYGAGFWVSMTALVVVATVLLITARWWHRDLLLVLALSLLAIMRACAYDDRLANPLAWTLVALVCLAWAVAETRSAVRAGFLTAAGVFALFAAAEWLRYAHTPTGYRGLVIVVVGSLGLLAAQRLVGQAPHETAPDRARALNRAVAEGLSVTWLVVGVAMAERSPSHRALELTVVGVAAGITAYLSDDRRRAGWVSGMLLTVASWIRLTDYDVEAVEWYTVPAATALLVYGIRRLLRRPRESTWRCLGPGMALALTPSLFLALDQPVTLRGLFVALASVSLVALGVRVRLAAPFALGVLATGLLALRNIWPVAAFLPRWTLLFLVGAALLVVGMTWESRVNDVRRAGGFVRGLR